MVSRADIIEELKSLGGVSTSEGTYYRFEHDEGPKGGANGFVLKAVYDTNKEVAVKFYFQRDPSFSENDDDEDNLKRFMNEISILEKSECPYLVKCYGKGTINIKGRTLPFYVMPYAKGSMKDLLDQQKFKDINFTYPFFHKLGIAIQYLHRQEVNGEKCYHRDLKPVNILFTKEDEPLLADLGLAHINPNFAIFSVDSVRELRNPYYCAPEQIFGFATDVDHRADIYAYGVMLREALTNEHPRGENAPLPSETLGSKYIGIDAVIMKCIEYDKRERYQTMDECLVELRIAFEGPTIKKEWMAAFYIARQKIKTLARYWTLTSELLSADNLRSLYLLASAKL